MIAEPVMDLAVSRIAAAIGEPARARMLYCLLDGRSRTSTELAGIGEVTPSTASVHLSRLKTEGLIKVFVQGKHRYYSLENANVARALEGLSVLAGGRKSAFVPRTPNQLRMARSCYDHMAGTLGVQLHDCLMNMGWMVPRGRQNYDLSATGVKGIATLGIDVAQTRMLRRRFAYACLDWSERRPHIGGALGAAILEAAIKKRWLQPQLEGRALAITATGKREFQARFGLTVPS